jgi:crotonobetainyl-CoA:carnitine CoA-transferase CaiB-like acyl-CoA transferase
VTPGPLQGVRVLDCATLFAGPLAATILGDYGADVIKIEFPVRGDPSRHHGPAKNGSGLWWKMLGRNKYAVTLNLGSAEGADLLLRLAERSDVLVENFRPGTLERWGVGPDQLYEANPGLVLARVTGFGQFGPYARRPAFGTLAESMSGFAALTGQPDGPPTLPPFGLADGVSALTAATAIMMALYRRDARGGGGQVLDIAIAEPLLTILGPQATAYDQLGEVQPRTGNRSVNNSPRNTYLTRDHRWVAISTSAQSVAERVMRLVGHPEVISQPWFATGRSRAEHADELDALVGGWVAVHDLADVMTAFEEADAAVAPIYDIKDVLADPHFQARETITTVDDDELGPLKMQNVLFRMSQTPGAIRWTGRALGADNDEIYGELLGIDQASRDRLRAAGVI